MPFTAQPANVLPLSYWPSHLPAPVRPAPKEAIGTQSALQSQHDRRCHRGRLTPDCGEFPHQQLDAGRTEQRWPVSRQPKKLKAIAHTDL